MRILYDWRPWQDFNGRGVARYVEELFGESTIVLCQTFHLDTEVKSMFAMWKILTKEGLYKTNSMSF